jgi:NitT/TauT family transport system substrate-binding protein
LSTRSLALVAALLVTLSLADPIRAQGLEKTDVKLGVGGASALYYLPLALTDKLGFFKAQA